MGHLHPFELMEEVAELFIVGGLSYDQLAAKTGVSKRQLVRWGTNDKWVERRAEYRKASCGIRRSFVLLRSALIEKAMESLDPQDIYALTRLEALNIRAQAEQDEIQIDRPAIFLESIQFIAETLKEIDPEALRVMARHFDTLVSKFKQSAES